MLLAIIFLVSFSSVAIYFFGYLVEEIEFAKKVATALQLFSLVLVTIMIFALNFVEMEVVIHEEKPIFSLEEESFVLGQGFVGQTKSYIFYTLNEDGEKNIDSRSIRHTEIIESGDDVSNEAKLLVSYEAPTNPFWRILMTRGTLKTSIIIPGENQSKVLFQE